jgi:hypothetical protein
MKNSQLDAVFTYSAITFNVFVSALYIATKFDEMQLVQSIGLVIITLTIPFSITLIGYVKNGEEKKTIISNSIILIYLFIEILLEYILKIPFRDILAIHIPYIVILWAALYSMMAISYKKNRRTGIVVIATFILLVVCLAYYLIPI